MSKNVIVTGGAGFIGSALCRHLISERGWRVIYTPYAELEHAESSTRGSLHPTIDEAFFQQRWGTPYTAFDPFYTPNLELMQPWSVLANSDLICSGTSGSRSLISIDAKLPALPW